MRSVRFLDGVQSALRRPLLCVGRFRAIEHRDCSSWSRAQLSEIQPGMMGSRLKVPCPVRSVFVSV